MSKQELQHEIQDGIVFWGYEQDGTLEGVMGVQQVKDVTLIRHAYVRSGNQKRGIGTQLLLHLLGTATRPVLIDTWADAAWAIVFYYKHGFQTVSHEEKELLLRLHCKIQ